MATTLTDSVKRDLHITSDSKNASIEEAIETAKTRMQIIGVETIKEAVKQIRVVRTNMNVPIARKASIFVVSDREDIRRIFEEGRVFFMTLAHANEVTIQADRTGIADDAVSAVIPGATIYMPFSDLVDLDKEIERLTKEKERLTKEIARSNGMLGNPRFTEKAPAEKVEEERQKLVKYTDMMAQVEERLALLVK